MTNVQYDFAVLGDNQPEGLLVASGLVRKGYSVVLVPSTSLGEMPSEDLIPTLYPAQTGGRRVDDLLFRAGFFRLEDSGLMAQPQQSQVILPRQRLSFDGSWEKYVSELKREFPLVADRFLFLCEQAKTHTSSSTRLKKLASQVHELSKKNPEFGRWLHRSLSSQLRPSSSAISELQLIRHFLEDIMGGQGKAYRVDSKLKMPYGVFLTEHARKWGVQVYSDAFQMKQSWAGFEMAEGVRAKALVLNSVGARRSYLKSLKEARIEKLTHWLYIDRIECGLSVLPEPLEENSILDLSMEFNRNEFECVLNVKKDALRDEAVLSLGTWLDFDESKDWIKKIEASRKVLSKLVPFMPLDNFRKLPSLLELTEIRGESVRRGQVERLMAEPQRPNRWNSMMRWISPGARPTQLARRVYSLNPLDLPFRNRRASFEAALRLLDYFDERRSRLRPNSLF